MSRLAAIILFAGCLLAQPQEASAFEKPKLLLVVVVDQMPAHAMSRWGHLLNGGLKDLSRKAAYFPQVHYAYANTETAAGHATLATGAWPSVHGFIGNRWFDEATGREVYCAEDPKAHRGPMNLRVTGFGEAVRHAQKGRGKVIALSGKDRAAIALGGARPTLAAWYDKRKGTYVAGSWDKQAPAPTWFTEWATRLNPEANRGSMWRHFRKDVDYERAAGPDDRPSEETLPGIGRTFPHKLAEGVPPDAWRGLYRVTPASIDDLIELAEVTIRAEKLGRRDELDYLAVSISTMDYVGHEFGSHAQETLDVFLRIDAAVGRLVKTAQKLVGKRNLLVAVTSDHGAVLTPEEADSYSVSARRINPKELVKLAEPVLPRGVTIADVNSPFIFFGKMPDSVDQTAARRAVATAITEHPDIIQAVAREDVNRLPDPYGQYFRRSMAPGRRADILILHRPHHYVSWVGADGLGRGSGHGSPYTYDTAVPLWIFGPGVARRVDRQRYEMVQLAPTLAALLAIDPPAAAHAPLLPGVVPGSP